MPIDDFGHFVDQRTRLLRLGRRVGVDDFAQEMAHGINARFQFTKQVPGGGISKIDRLLAHTLLQGEQLNRKLRSAMADIVHSDSIKIIKERRR